MSSNLYDFKHGHAYKKNSTKKERSVFASDVYFYDDFLGADGAAAMVAAGSEEAGCKWSVTDVGAATQSFGADAANGTVIAALTNASEAQDADIYWGDQLGIDISNGGEFEYRAQLSVLPTTGAACVLGFGSAHNLDKDTMTINAWFRWQASAALLVETDDTTNDENDTATGITTVVSTYDIYRIECWNLADVKFYVNGVRIASGTTFDMSNLSAAESIVQPYFGIDKASGTGVGTLQVDYFKYHGNRGA